MSETKISPQNPDDTLASRIAPDRQHGGITGRLTRRLRSTMVPLALVAGSLLGSVALPASPANAATRVNTSDSYGYISPMKSSINCKDSGTSVLSYPSLWTSFGIDQPFGTTYTKVWVRASYTKWSATPSGWINRGTGWINNGNWTTFTIPAMAGTKQQLPAQQVQAGYTYTVKFEVWLQDYYKGTWLAHGYADGSAGEYYRNYSPPLPGTGCPVVY